jgi:hypothetical protein
MPSERDNEAPAMSRNDAIAAIVTLLPILSDGSLIRLAQGLEKQLEPPPPELRYVPPVSSPRRVERQPTGQAG